MQLYIDESGDTGFSFEKPNRSGGSSRYLTIASLLIPKTKRHIPKRIVRKVYNKRKRKTDNELKGHMLNIDEKQKIIDRTKSMLKSNKDIKILGITVNKQNVQAHIAEDSNKLYNYMIKIMLERRLKNITELEFIPDPRSIKVASGNSLLDYIQTTIWFDWDLETKLKRVALQSDNSLNLQYIDFISYMIWSYFEDGDNTSYDDLKPLIIHKRLFF